ncbi:TetR family transcriptional regulator [Paenibacillus sp. J23TS9]|uniref:TetR/AcrR family transcriptional regulator n=1 Tax=Paenibacillus sp. J23TS9 TaxID=2807193 RepID=UPI001B2437BB|nr:TetR/AcrR family transcriptional regulator [Paenibacillus sp. J23TS9]GIP26995.1 TetR family transcriptional regulator [Paenibacillus sp. J23TS9]
MKNNSDTKQKLIQVTREMIDQQGIDAINMRDLGKKINLSRGALYRHFKNKDDLLATIATENFVLLNRNIQLLSDKIYEPRPLLYAILLAYYDFGINNQEHYQLMFRKQWDKEMYPELVTSAFFMFTSVEKCLEKAGNIRKSSNQSTAMMYAFIHGLVELNISEHSESEKGLDSPIQLIDSFLDLIFMNS